MPHEGVDVGEALVAGTGDAVVAVVDRVVVGVLTWAVLGHDDAWSAASSDALADTLDVLPVMTSGRPPVLDGEMGLEGCQG